MKDLIWMYLNDFNSNGKIDLYDAVTLLVAYGSKPGDINWNPDADLVQDNAINLYDAVTLLRYYGMYWQPS